MYEAHHGLSQAPFQNVPDPAFFCPLAAHQEALEKLLYAVQYSKGGAVLTAEAGCGKSTLSRVFLLQLKEEKYDIGLVINPSLPPEELLFEIALQLGLRPASSQRGALFRLLNDHVLANANEDRATVVIIDEAHVINHEAAFEDLRMLLNFQLNDRYLLSLILTGLPELRTKLDGLPAFNQRMAFRLNLSPLNKEETPGYVQFRLKKAGATRQIFTDEAIRMIYRETGGVPRNINKLCDLCLYESWRRKAKKVDVSLVRLALASA
ncbi:MAG: ExeA family protein [Thermoplasmata archaeon]